MESNELKNRVIEVSKIYSFDADEMLRLLTPHNEALNWINKAKSSATTHTKFKNHLEFTRDVFLGLNDHVKNDGNKKLSKRCGLLLEQLEKYRNNQSISPKVKSYFSSLFKDDLPTPANIFSIASSNIHYYSALKNLEYMDYHKDIAKDIFNTSFNISFKYTVIAIHTDSMDVDLQAQCLNKPKVNIFNYST